ncbi:MAG: hypothetical protein CL905_01105 [Dehalococcoidia bacterium]|nr:hypothetical protein [Dehalococcoidia bacterium]
MHNYKFFFKLISMLLILSVLISCNSDTKSISENPIVTQNENILIPFRDISKEALGKDRMIENRYPGVAIFDFDRDGDMDIYVTSAETNSLIEETRGGNNKLFENLGNEKFAEISDSANVTLPESNSTAVAACDFNNDGYQDLYVASYGRIGDGLDYRSVSPKTDLFDIVKDRLLLNNKNGTFTDITSEAFGDEINIRSGISVSCGDIDNDGWIDIFVGNRADQDYIAFNNPRHHGHYNVLYKNNANLTFSDITEKAGLKGPNILMRMPHGEPIKWFDEESQRWNEGYDPNFKDINEEKVGDPTGQTLAAVFWDHDLDSDIDLWISDDGDRLKVYRNDSDLNNIKFTLITRELGIDKVGAWMGFSIGDIDSDADLDVFVTNIGFHPLTRTPPEIPGGDCAYGHIFSWGTCFHYLLRNDSTQDEKSQIFNSVFNNISDSIIITPDKYLPTEGLNIFNILEDWQIPKGLDAYEFGFGSALFDYENDGDIDLYWLGSMGGRGEGPGGLRYPGPGRMFLNLPENFEDITTESHLLDIDNVNYELVDASDENIDLESNRIGIKFHENGKGLAKGDLNNDGYIDLIATNSNGYIFKNGTGEMNGGPLFLWINGGGNNNWISLRLKGRMSIDGTGSNSDAIGSIVTIKYLNEGEEITQVKQVTSGESFISANSLDVNFGLGKSTEIDELLITWPNGNSQTFENVKVNQILEITEKTD